MSAQFNITKKAVSNNPNRWMFSFADLLSLILTFFILIFSMADPIQLTNKFSQNHNSPASFKKSEVDSQIKVGDQQVIDSDYMESIIRNKIANDDGMKKFNVKIINDKLTIYTSKTNLSDAAVQALHDSISSLASKTTIVAANLEDARNVAYKFHNIGMTENLSYSEDNNLQNNVKIILYPKF